MRDEGELIGRRFGKLLVIRFLGSEGGAKYLCKCNWGKEKIVRRKYLLNGRVKTCGECRKILLEDDHYRYMDDNGNSFIFDSQDLPLAKKHYWYIDDYGYAVAKVNRKTVRFTRILLGVSENEVVDHINGNTKDNRRCNLRIASRRENQGNMRLPTHNTSGFKGVSFRKDRGKYRAYISINNRIKHLGYYDTPEDAARAYDEAARFYFAEFACVNFPRPGEQGCRCKANESYKEAV